MCPNCKIKMNKGICLKCGYMENGNQIKQYKKQKRFDDIRIYNEDFDEMNTNEKKYINFILGPIYFSYRNHLVVGTIISIISILIYHLEMTLTNSLLSIGGLADLFAFINIVIYITINRILYMSFSNIICIKLDNIKISKIKREKNYMQKLVKHNSKSVISVITQIIILIGIIAISLIKK